MKYILLFICICSPVFAKELVTKMGVVSEHRTKYRDNRAGTPYRETRLMKGNVQASGWSERSISLDPPTFEVYVAHEIDEAFRNRDHQITQVNQRIDRRRNEIHTLQSQVEELKRNTLSDKETLHLKIEQMDEKFTRSIEELVPVLQPELTGAVKTALVSDKQFTNSLVDPLTDDDELIDAVIDKLIRNQRFVHAIKRIVHEIDRN